MHARFNPGFSQYEKVACCLSHESELLPGDAEGFDCGLELCETTQISNETSLFVSMIIRSKKFDLHIPNVKTITCKSMLTNVSKKRSRLLCECQ